MREVELRNKVVVTAKSFLGYSESKQQDDIIIRKFNEVKPKGMYTMNMTDSWCAAYGSVVGHLAGLSSIIPIECSCQRQIELWKKLGRWEEDGTKIPKMGDYIYYNWDDNSQPNNGWADHVGIVVSVSGNTIKIIEGNFNDAVGYRTIKVGWGYIRGYGLPDYASLATKESSPEGIRYAIGDVVEFTGKSHYLSSYEAGKRSGCTSGKAEVTNVKVGQPHPYHLVGLNGCTVYGWVDAADISGTAKNTTATLNVGDKVKVLVNKTYDGKKFTVYYDKYDVIEVKGDRVVIGRGKTTTCAIHKNNVKKV